ncbi:hypothetical protein BZG36_03500 [Bifiguratus adelaidae]|uniref:Major facilitator superfamily (MFS) profile domain-containing protein n=1 Tax=Bifiguratus adelaidae TaxID=1938954 RepID=A0A261XZ94_9FUNG|nr:hypothetical protein BZG36_03500 [Bifiguratus adelaidae]
MSDYGSYSLGGAGGEHSNSSGGGDKKQQVMDQVRSELALANAQELINNYYVDASGSSASIISPSQAQNKALIAFVGTLGYGLTWEGSIFVSPLMARTKDFKWITVPGAILMSAGYALAGSSTQLWHLALTQGLIFGIGGSMVYFPALSVAPEYFERRRGAAMGFILSGAGMGGLIWSPVAGLLLDRLGARWALRTIGLLNLAISLPIALCAVPSRYTVWRPTLVNVNIARKPAFILQSVAACLQASGNAIPLNFVPAFSVALGYSAGFGAILLSVSNGVNSVSRIFMGLVGDSVGRQNTIIINSIGAALSVLVLWFLTVTSGANGLWIAFVILYGILAGGYNELFPTTVAEVFGTQAYASVNGFLYFVRGVGVLFGSPVAGAIVRRSPTDSSGSTSFHDFKWLVWYNGLLLLVTGVCVMGVRGFDALEKASKDTNIYVTQSSRQCDIPASWCKKSKSKFLVSGWSQKMEVQITTYREDPPGSKRSVTPKLPKTDSDISASDADDYSEHSMDSEQRHRVENGEFYEVDIGEDVKSDNKSQIIAALKLLKKFVGVKDIVSLRISLPAQLLEPIGNLEYWNYNDRPDYFAAMDTSDDPLERMLGVIRWLYTKDLKFATGKIIKPYNSILGEQFFCHWDVVEPQSDDHGNIKASMLSSEEGKARQMELNTTEDQEKVRVICINEQISHHPPVSAFHMACPKRGIEACGFDHITARFTGTTFKVGPGERNKGIYVTLRNRDDEEYQCTHPNASVAGWLRGHLYAAVADSTIVNCPRTGLRAVLEYKEERWLGKARFAIEGKIYKVNPKDESATATSFRQIPKKTTILAAINGSWRGEIKAKRLDTDEERLLLDMRTLECVPKVVKPIEEQDEMESRRIWNSVTTKILAHEFSQATKAKQAIEERQRQLAAERKQRNQAFVPIYFEEPVVDGKPVLTSQGKSKVAAMS